MTSIKREDEQTVDDYCLFRHTLFHNHYHFQATQTHSLLLDMPPINTTIVNLQE